MKACRPNQGRSIGQPFALGDRFGLQTCRLRLEQAAGRWPAGPRSTANGVHPHVAVHSKVLGTMSTTRVRIDPDDPVTFPGGVVDATTEAEIAPQQKGDDAEAMQDMAGSARRIRRRLGLSQMELARRTDVPHETIRNWEQGKRSPTGAARALMRVLDKAPETALRVLT